MEWCIFCCCRRCCSPALHTYYSLVAAAVVVTIAVASVAVAVAVVAMAVAVVVHGAFSLAAVDMHAVIDVTAVALGSPDSSSR